MSSSSLDDSHFKKKYGGRRREVVEHQNVQVDVSKY